MWPQFIAPNTWAMTNGGVESQQLPLIGKDVGDYGDIIYQGAAATTLKPLDAIYHSALCFVTDNRFHSRELSQAFA